MNDNGHEVVECLCLPQFTGLYCDKLATGATFYELLFYSPIFAMIAVLIFIGFCYQHVEGVKKIRPMEFEKHVPRVDLSVDMRKLFPEKFLTPQQYAKLAAEEAEASEEELKEPQATQKTTPQESSTQKMTQRKSFLEKVYNNVCMPRRKSCFNVVVKCF
ncbi:unnamed protein product [Strongylus vulgaris]|uniref:EGF-like domain-containing protein n=1 Tax=Strongylus vulgaris TaxID=40348 RepID=A0A3P7J816_STRVU|nr:unnamed protein product [Strongylus vulgaris]